MDEACATPSSNSTIDSVPASPSEVKRLSPVKTGISLLGLSDLEFRLFDHYCSSVAPIISAHDHLRQMWQHEIPQQAKAHPYLMHSMLSISASHLCGAYAKQPLEQQPQKILDVSPVIGESILKTSFYHDSFDRTERQMQQSHLYECHSLEQQRLAFQAYIPSLCTLNVENQEALCAASALLSLNALASTQNRYCAATYQSRHPSPIDDWLEISVLVRGVNSVVQNAGATIMDGFLQPMLCHRRVEGTESDIESQIKQAVSPQVLSALDALALAIDQHTALSVDKMILHAALKFLKTSFAIVAVNADHESIVMVWSNLLDDQFFPLVKRREPMALILLAYWTVLFGTFQERWWIGGLGIAILRHIVEFLAQPEDGNVCVQEGEYTLTYHSLKQHSDGASDLGAGKAKWRELLQWPCRQSGFREL
ncbi:uncharacterized protein KY384_002201 [Bacidia gigantensis]|uniref:uncharacterized protein n=1 Tax=Bacidia gigantensis TaxID=2732470 RepID=UPI001D051445|nr:uncharacterized protein KY384_002201 [Bacidia gigantensis]KAG8533418.1 hypothetical protein KY384_002201 [Bacidia gigantensis]